MNIDFTAILAVYGAILATVVLLWDVVKYVRDRPGLMVKVDHHVLVGPQLSEHKIGIYMVNTGKRPLTVVASGFRLSTQAEENIATVMDPTLPKELAEGQSHTTYANPNEIEVNKILFAWARDATGREYRSKKRPLRSSTS